MTGRWRWLAAVVVVGAIATWLGWPRAAPPSMAPSQGAAAWALEGVPRERETEGAGFDVPSERGAAPSRIASAERAAADGLDGAATAGADAPAEVWRTVHVEVRTAEGAALSGVDLSLSCREGSSSRGSVTGVTGDDGAARLAAPLEWAEFGDTVLAVYVRRTEGWIAAPATLVLGPEQDRVVARMVRPRPFTGVVVDPAGAPVAGVGVELFGMDPLGGYAALASGESGEDGAFSLTADRLQARMAVCASHPEFAMTWSDGRLPSDDPRYEHRIVLEPVLEWSIRVEDTAGEAIAGANVSISTWGNLPFLDQLVRYMGGNKDREGTRNRVARTDEGGRAVLRGWGRGEAVLVRSISDPDSRWDMSGWSWSSEGSLGERPNGLLLEVPPAREVVVRIEREHAMRLQIEVDWLRHDAIDGYRFMLCNDEGNAGWGLSVRSKKGARLSFEHWLSASFARLSPNLYLHVRDAEMETLERLGPIPAVAGVHGPYVVR